MDQKYHFKQIITLYYLNMYIYIISYFVKMLYFNIRVLIELRYFLEPMIKCNVLGMIIYTSYNIAWNGGSI